MHYYVGPTSSLIMFSLLRSFTVAEDGNVNKPLCLGSVM